MTDQEMEVEEAEVMMEGGTNGKKGKRKGIKVENGGRAETNEQTMGI